MMGLIRFRFFLWCFSHFKVPLIGRMRPKLYKLTDNEAVIGIPLKRRTKNHLNSMYFGALAVGADVAGGLHAFYHAANERVLLSLVFKSFHAQFFRRAESEVVFVCEMGDLTRQKILESKNTMARCNYPIRVKAYVNYFKAAEPVAEFTLEVSLKVTKIKS